MIRTDDEASGDGPGAPPVVRQPPPGDPMGLGREWVGWTPDQTPQQLYERNRGVWYLSARASRERYTAFSSTVTGTIVAVVANKGVENVDGRPRHQGILPVRSSVCPPAFDPGRLVLPLLGSTASFRCYADLEI